MIDAQGYTLLYCAFDELYKVKQFCGSRAADFVANVSDVICIPISLEEIEQANFSNTNQIFRRIMHYKSRAGAGNTSVLVLVYSSEEKDARIADDLGSDEAGRVVKAMRDYLTALELDEKVLLTYIYCK
jgi:hypothetical protein